MPRYFYQALNATRQVERGEIEATSLAQAVSVLEVQGLVVQSIGAMRPADQEGNDYEASLEPQFAPLMERGRKLLPALQAYSAERLSRLQRRRARTVIDVLERSDAMGAVRSLHVWPNFWISLMGANDNAASLAAALERVFEHSRREAELDRRWWLILMYPLILTVVAVAILTLISLYLIPVMAETLISFRLRLPLLTTIVLAVSQEIASGRILLYLLMVTAIGFGVRFASRWLPLETRHGWQDTWSRYWGRSATLSRFTDHLANLLRAEQSVPQALRVASLAVGSAPLRRAAWRLADQDSQFATNVVDPLAPSLSNPFGDTVAAVVLDSQQESYFKRMLTASIIHALRGEMRNNARIELLREISHVYARKITFYLAWLHGVIEPLAIVIVGLLVGPVVLGLLWPLFRLMTGLSM